VGEAIGKSIRNFKRASSGSEEPAQPPKNDITPKQ